MAQFQTVEVAGFAPAIAGMRHPLKSYDKADSGYDEDGGLHIGKNDYDLAKRLCQAGSPEHAKFLRQICVWVNITAPRYWWSEFDTYKIGTTANSQSTMHRLIKDGISVNEIDFPWGVNPSADVVLDHLIHDINEIIAVYKEVDEEYKNQYFAIIKALLPEGYVQTRMVSLNYQVLRTMYNQRKNHKLSHWNTDFVNWVHTLPMSEWITGDFPEEKDEEETEENTDLIDTDLESTTEEESAVEDNGQLQINFDEDNNEDQEKTVDEQ